MFHGEHVLRQQVAGMLPDDRHSEDLVGTRLREHLDESVRVLVGDRAVQFLDRVHARQDDDLGAAPGVAEQHEGLRREIPSSVLHHLKKVRPRLFDRHAIDLSHLVGRDGLDRDAAVGKEARRHCWRAYSDPQESKVILLTGACQARI